MDFLDELEWVRRHGERLDWYLRRRHPDGLTEPAQDPTLSGGLAPYAPGKGGRTLSGFVVDAIPSLGFYRVQLEDGLPPVPCALLSDAGANPVGGRRLQGLAPHDRVQVRLPDGATYPLIVGVEPMFMTDGRAGLGDWVSQQSACGLQVDECHAAALRLPFAGVVDWGGGLPLDSTTVGEDGWAQRTGVMVFHDPFMAFLRADENCGVWAFMEDQLLRLHGHNFQERTAGGEREALDDENEWNLEEGWTPGYTWEALGAFDPEAPPAVNEASADAVQRTAPHYGTLEPAEDDRKPFYRRQRYMGYLGQGGTDLLCAPPVAPPATNRYHQLDVYAGLFWQHLALTGRLTLATAKGVTLAKRPALPTPRRIRRPEDAQGDSSEQGNYNPCGFWGPGPAHVVTDQPAVPATPDVFQTGLAGAYDRLAYAYNYEGLQPFQDHQQDFLVPEESETPAGLLQPPVNYASLASAFNLEAPPSLQLKIDHRYDRVDYVPNMSLFDMNDQGGLLLADAFGARLATGGGNMYIDLPGDLYVRCGRRVVCLSGMDFIARAHNAMELTTTLGDQRLKAGKNQHFLSGNKGTGGTLIENRALEPDYSQFAGQVGSQALSSGVVVKAAKTDFAVWADRVYLRCGVPGLTPDGDATAGAGRGIFLDAGQGQGYIITYSDTFERYLRTAAFDYFGTDGAVLSGNAYTVDCTVLGGKLCVINSASVGGDLVADRNIVSVTGHVATKRAPDFGYQVLALTGEALSQATAAVDGCVIAEATTVANGINGYTADFQADVYFTDSLGENATIKRCGFTFRTTDQAKASGVLLFESLWQQQARLSGSSLQVWQEDPVDGPSTPAAHYPWPGKDLWKNNAAFYRQDLTLFDAVAGRDLPRTDAAYQAPTLATPVAAVADDVYTVIDPAN